MDENKEGLKLNKSREELKTPDFVGLKLYELETPEAPQSIDMEIEGKAYTLWHFKTITPISTTYIFAVKAYKGKINSTPTVMYRIAFHQEGDIMRVKTNIRRTDPENLLPLKVGIRLLEKGMDFIQHQARKDQKTYKDIVIRDMGESGDKKWMEKCGPLLKARKYVRGNEPDVEQEHYVHFYRPNE